MMSIKDIKGASFPPLVITPETVQADPVEGARTIQGGKHRPDLHLVARAGALAVQC